MFIWFRFVISICWYDFVTLGSTGGQHVSRSVSGGTAPDALPRGEHAGRDVLMYVAEAPTSALTSARTSAATH